MGIRTLKAWAVLAGSMLLPSAARGGATCLDEGPPTVTLTGVARDFLKSHPDMNLQPGGSRWSHAVKQAKSTPVGGDPVLGGDWDPQPGIHKIASQWKDAQNRTICPCIPPVDDPEYGADNPGQWSNSAEDGGITSAETFDEWFTDMPGVNMSALITITLVFDEAAQMYVFDDTLDPGYEALGGFFPIDNVLFGNEGEDHNTNFTFELHTKFKYCEDDAPFFKFVGDGDLYVFINDHLVTDIGGIHATHDHYVDISRPGLASHLDLEKDGDLYRMDIYFAQRSKEHFSHFRIETNVVPVTADVPSVNASVD